MTPSDEAVERGARALAANEDEDWWSDAHDEFRSADRRAWEGDEEVHVATCHRFIARAVLDAAFPPNTYDAESEYAKGRADEAMLRGGSGEYQRAVSDVVEALRAVAEDAVKHGGKPVANDYARFIERRFAPTSEGEE